MRCAIFRERQNTISLRKCHNDGSQNRVRQLLGVSSNEWTSRKISLSRPLQSCSPFLPSLPSSPPSLPTAGKHSLCTAPFSWGGQGARDAARQRCALETLRPRCACASRAANPATRDVHACGEHRGSVLVRRPSAEDRAAVERRRRCRLFYSRRRCAFPHRGSRPAFRAKRSGKGPATRLRRLSTSLRGASTADWAAVGVSAGCWAILHTPFAFLTPHPRSSPQCHHRHRCRRVPGLRDCSGFPCHRRGCQPRLRHGERGLCPLRRRHRPAVLRGHGRLARRLHGGACRISNLLLWIRPP